MTFLGTACGVPMSDRWHSSILFENGERRWLLDAGEPSSQRLKALGIRFSLLDAILISHGHSDHLSGLPMIIQGAWLEGRTAPLPLYLPAELIAPVRMWLEAVYLPEKLVGFPIVYHAWEALPPGGAELDGGQLRVTVNPTTHLYGLRGMIDPGATDRFLAYSMVLEWPETGRRVIYTGDLGQPRDLDAILQEPCDLLICEMAHFTPKELFTYLRDKSIRRLALTHFTPEFGGQAAAICELGGAMLPGVERVEAMRDGQRLEF